MSRKGPPAQGDNVRDLFSNPGKRASSRKDIVFPAAKTAALSPPGWMTPTGAAAWRKVVPIIVEAAPDFISEVDVGALALMFEHYAVAVAASKSMRGRGGHYKVTDVDEAHGSRTRKTPAWQVFREASATYLAITRDLALTPTARRGLDLALFAGSSASQPGDEDDDLFDDAAP